MDGTVYVYGVLAADDAPSVAVVGVEGRPVRTVEREGLSALVSDLDAGELAAAREVRAHWRVLEEATQAATVVPTRFGTVMAGDAAVADDLLAANAPRLSALLGELAGRVQLSVKGAYDEEQLLRAVVASSREVAALREHVAARPGDAGYYDRIRLGELVAAQVARVREADTALALEHLQPLAVAARAEDPGRPDAAFDLAFLVDRAGVDAFGEGVGALMEALGERVAVRFVGPLPPYSFAEAELTGGGA